VKQGATDVHLQRNKNKNNKQSKYDKWAIQYQQEFTFARALKMLFHNESDPIVDM
jgi:hypothetical protein